LSDGEPRVTAADNDGAASLLNHSPRKRLLQNQYSDSESRAAKLQKSRINQLWRFDPRLASRQRRRERKGGLPTQEALERSRRAYHSPLATKCPVACVGNLRDHT